MNQNSSKTYEDLQSLYTAPTFENDNNNCKRKNSRKVTPEKRVN